MRLAWRLAHREVRRRPGRTTLVVLLVAVTVAAITVADVSARTRELPAPVALGNAAAKSVLVAKNTRVLGELTTLESFMPPGMEYVGGWEVGFVPVQRRDRLGLGSFSFVSTVDATRPLLAGMVQVRSGRLPTAVDEALLGSRTASRLQLTIGATLHLARPHMDLRVVGVGATAETDDILLAPGYPVDQLAPGRANAVVYTQTLLSQSVLLDLQSKCCGEQQPFTFAPNVVVPPQPLPTDRGKELIAWLVVTLVLSVLGIVIAAAFAAGGRRQLVMLGQLAATGADEGVALRFLTLQGSVLGAVGAILGVVSGIVVVSMHSWSSHLLSGRSPRLMVADFAVLGATTILVSTVAAALPARHLAKAPVLTALAGRAPVVRVQRRQLPIAAITIALGLLVLGFAVASTHRGGGSATLKIIVALLSGGAVLAGTCLFAPIIVQWWGPVAARAGGSTRLAVRSMVRHRARSAALVAAIAAIGALGVAGASGVERWSQLSTRALPPPRLDLVWATFAEGKDPSSTKATVESIVGRVSWKSLPTVSDSNGQTWVVADDTSMTTLGVSSSFWPVVRSKGQVQLIRGRQMPDGSGASGPVTIEQLDGLVLPSVALMTSDEARRQGLDASGRLELGMASHVLSDAERDQLGFWQETYTDGFLFDQPTPSNAPTSLVWESPYGSPRLTRATARWLLILALLLLVALVVVLGLALWSAEGKVERDQLVAVGASPRLLARVAGARAWVLAATGGVMAVPLGVGTLWVVMSALHNHSPFPWLASAMVACGIPCVVGVGAGLGSLWSQRTRPVTGATMSLD